MNLSFSTNRWNGIELNEFIDIANEHKFKGIEIHSINEIKKENAVEIYHKLLEYKIKIPCIDMVSDISGSDTESAVNELKKCIEFCNTLHSKYIRIKAYGKDENNVKRFIKEALPYVEKNQVIMLVETVGIYSDTLRLRELLNTFACDNLAALWDLHYPYRENNESPEKTVENLGAYIKHIHMKDSDEENSYNLVGEGSLPIPEIINALRSINYDGFISIEWDPSWDSEIADMEIIFPHFVSY
ncbi:MAG: sugar phosphate isomerase/epimerase, partial [Clostridia bacterium]|nr:sugar phosphate isomerase/epimerase [Clostridia bacterium]